MVRKRSSPGDPTPRNGTRPVEAQGLRRGVLASMRAIPDKRGRSSVNGSIHDGMGRLDGLDDLSNGEWLSQNAVETTLHKLRSLTVGDATAHRDDSSDLKFFVATDHLAELATVVFGDAELVEHDMRPETFALHTGGEEAVAGVDVEVRLFGKHRGECVDDPLVLITDQNSRATAHQAVHRDVMLPHEGQKVADRDATVLRARNAISLELPGVEPLAHRTAGDVADLRHLAGGEDILVEKIELFVAHVVASEVPWLAHDRSRFLREVAAQDIGPTARRIEFRREGSCANSSDQTLGIPLIKAIADKQPFPRV